MAHKQGPKTSRLAHNKGAISPSLSPTPQGVLPKSWHLPEGGTAPCQTACPPWSNTIRRRPPIHRPEPGGSAPEESSRAEDKETETSEGTDVFHRVVLIQRPGLRVRFVEHLSVPWLEQLVLQYHHGPRVVPLGISCGVMNDEDMMPQRGQTKRGRRCSSFRQGINENTFGDVEKRCTEETRE
jgi:hypothetical protein